MIKKSILLLLSILIVSATACAQGQATEKYISDIYEGWANQTITKVENGKFVTLLQAFNRVWPNSDLSCILEVIKEGAAEKMLDEDTGLKVINDSRNGYVSLSDAGTDGSYMSACVWNRTNGHKLLAICMGKPTDPCLDFVCYYDYNPKTKTLKPEPELQNVFDRRFKNSQVFNILPRVGKELKIMECDEGECYVHYFYWDGMKPVFDHISKDETIE